jgi:hypothetical protein
MVLGALIAWADIDSDHIAATTFGLLVLSGGAVVAAVSHVLGWRTQRLPAVSSDVVTARPGDLPLPIENAMRVENA